MKWSWRIGRLLGVDVYMHATFLILLVWLGISYYLPQHRLSDVINGLTLIVALFAIVILHEMGHALTARRFGIRTRDITLLPIGGVARLERMPDNPKQELMVALAGPVVNVALAGLLLLTILLIGATLTLPDSRLAGGSLLSNLMWINVVVAAFNMIPAFPMDGGRVLRALLAMKMDYVHATQAAAGVGQALALVFGLVGLFYNPFLVFIALFVWMGAAAESSMVQMKSALAGIPMSKAMITDFGSLAPGNSLQEAIEHVLAGFQHDFPVLDQGRLVGVLTRDDLLKSLAQTGPETRVAVTMTEQFEIGDPAEMLDLVLARLQSCRCRTLLVLKGGELVGILTMDNVGEFLMFQSALHSDARLGRIGMAASPARDCLGRT